MIEALRNRLPVDSIRTYPLILPAYPNFLGAFQAESGLLKGELPLNTAPNVLGAAGSNGPFKG